MKFTLNGPFRDNTFNMMRQISYHFLGGTKETELNFVRPLSNDYPRFHLYLQIAGENLIFSLHLDQKRPVYGGSTAHSGEYEGPVVEQEAERIKQALKL